MAGLSTGGRNASAAVPMSSYAERATHWRRVPLVANDRQARIAMAALTLLFGFSVLVMVPSAQFARVDSILVVIASLSTIPVAVAWLMARPWPSNALVVAFVVYADAAAIFVAAVFESQFVALQVGVLLCVIAVFAAVVGSQRLLVVHVGVSLTVLLILAALAIGEGSDPWLVASQTIVMYLLFAVPVVLQSYVGRLRRRASEAWLDPLTGLWNRRGLYDILDDWNSPGSEHPADSVLRVIVVDVDRFKILNDQFGRSSGDDVLCDVAQRLLAVADADSVVARLDGDQFVCVHRGARALIDTAEDRVRTAMADPFTGPPFTVSVGSASDAIIDDQSVSILVRRLVALADVDMYRTHRRATSDARFQCGDAGAPASALPAIRDRVGALIEAGGPDVVFQPVVSVATCETVGYEALSRFPLGSGSPDSWFREATVAGVEVELELAAIDAALVAMQSLPAGAFVSLNVSAETIRTADLLARLAPHLDSRLIYLELTEHQRVDDFGAIAPVVQDLRSAGVRLAIDDVGSGFASLLPVVELTPDLLKTDISLTRGIDTDRVRRAAAAAIVAFSHEIGAELLMEGIETIGEQRVAVNIGADLAQGFLHGRPKSVESYSGTWSLTQ
jgi:diguanylate cyclase (GGDEF)-like protein